MLLDRVVGSRQGRWAAAVAGGAGAGGIGENSWGKTAIQGSRDQLQREHEGVAGSAQGAGKCFDFCSSLKGPSFPTSV